jgi:Domain of Unknown Function (DUF1259)
MKNTAMVIGYMVLFEDEVNPAMSVALDEGLEGNRLHNHFFFEGFQNCVQRRDVSARCKP